MMMEEAICSQGIQSLVMITIFTELLPPRPPFFVARTHTPATMPV